MVRSRNRPAALMLGLGLSFLGACSSGRISTSPSPTPGTAGTAIRRGALEMPLSESYERAVEQGTRTHSGAPGPRY